MSSYILGFNPATKFFGYHDPAAVIFKDGELVFGIEEERLTRKKHATGAFPVNAIEECLDYCSIDISELEKIVLPFDPKRAGNIRKHRLSKRLSTSRSFVKRIYAAQTFLEDELKRKYYPTENIRERLESEFSGDIPHIEMKRHHYCHAVSAFSPSGFEDALVLTIDGRGEFDSTVVWTADENGLEEVHTYKFPNSLGHFYAIITEFLGYHAFNGEGKVMGLAPYGKRNDEIRSALLSRIDTGHEYDVTSLTKNGKEEGVSTLEDVLGRERNKVVKEFSQFEKDLAYAAQELLESIVVDIVDRYLPDAESSKVCLAGGVALNCKMNKSVESISAVDELFVQPIAHDAGSPLGAVMSETGGYNDTMERIYFGPSYSTEYIAGMLEEAKIEYSKPESLEEEVAERIAEGKLVGWFQGRMEMGPRALGNRSILADPRTGKSRDMVNEFVKHREGWRPFAPSMLEDRAEEYLVKPSRAPFMIKTFETTDKAVEEIPAVLHPGDNTTRPQLVSQNQNPRYYNLIDSFRDITGVPVVLNTSFNDHGEPIVCTPKEALKDFFAMGLDILAIEDILVEKEHLV